MESALGIFLIIGFILIAAAAITMGVLIVRYITDMRAQGFFGGKRKNEKE